MMSKKDFQKFANMIKNELEEEENQDVSAQKAIICVAYRMAKIFQDDNERFDKDRFLEACGSGHQRINPD